ncbi:TetR/AcrR family transcriptional regulator [Nonomuraea insulae]|uniref:TetR/AcrR family transcriptional regulator n=1 Tax=Nonomuraea insulae TaxID=1616787 RepID=A0ABW1DCJ8_9ACTN
MEEPGRRERKKQRTRQALVAEAMRLFEQQGYDRTTVAQIAAAADVSTRTFFLHFPAKEDVLLGDTVVRMDLCLSVIADRRPDERPADVLARAIEELITRAWADLSTGLARVRTDVLASSPAAQSRLLQRFLAAHAELTDALLRACPGELDRVAAATLVGGVCGAVGAAAFTSLRQGDPPERVREAMRRAIALSPLTP